MLVNTKEMYADSMAGGYAIGGFDATNHFLAECIINAAEAKNTPILLMVPGFAFGGPNDREFIRYLVQRCESAKIPIALHLDHAATYELCVYAISKGFTSVMIDGSSLPFQDNVELTKSVVKCAHACGVSVEAEIGHVGGDEGKLDGTTASENYYTQTPEALNFIEQTNTDSLAVAFGTVHGIYKGPPKLDFERLDDLRKNIRIPLVMHGGSGLSDYDFKKVIAHGINKINIFSEISLSSSRLLYKSLKKVDGNIHIQEALSETSDDIVLIIKKYIDLFHNL